MQAALCNKKAAVYKALGIKMFFSISRQSFLFVPLLQVILDAESWNL